MKALRDVAALQPVEWGTARLRVSSENACLPGTGTGICISSETGRFGYVPGRADRSRCGRDRSDNAVRWDLCLGQR